MLRLGSDSGRIRLARAASQRSIETEARLSYDLYAPFSDRFVYYLN